MPEADTPHPDQNFIDAVKVAAGVDPMPTVRQLARNVGLSPEEIVHYVLVQWASSGAEALMATPPLALRQLKAAADAGDTKKVQGIVSWLLAGE
ncbi:MAG: hypothetical protein FJY97_03440 [candidate division Zixibacteria bacterium]|nr:hypothetical protein [candidate division Zixibacteria bacterium]